MRPKMRLKIQSRTVLKMYCTTVVSVSWEFRVGPRDLPVLRKEASAGFPPRWLGR